MRLSTLACGLACVFAFAPASARAEPVSALYSSSAGFTADPGTFTVTGTTLDFGTIDMDAGSSGFLSVSGLAPAQNYTATFNVVDPALNSWTTLTAEILDPLSDGHDAMDPTPQPAFVPVGFSTSNNTDGISFAWNSGLDRSATFAGGGTANLFVDEDTNARDQLQFSGFTPDSVAATTFGLRDNSGGRTFLVRLSVDGTPSSPGQTPEPASLLLLGTGAAWLTRSRSRKGHQA
jgi:hypothetical protein